MSTRGDIEAGYLVGQRQLGGGNNNESVVETDKWASSLEIMLENVPRYMCSQGHPGRISRIPESLREVDIKSYEPCFMAIGPYHHDNPSVQNMEKKKLVSLKCFLEQRPDLRLKDMLTEMKSLEPAARSFYSDVNMGSEKFVEMLLLDSLYLVIVFCGVRKGEVRMDDASTENSSSINNQDTIELVNLISEGRDTVDDSQFSYMMEMEDQSNDDRLNGLRWFWPLLMHDLFLLENQLPFFVLQKMHDLVFSGSETELIDTIESMFHNLLLDYVKLNSKLVIPQSTEVHHLLHLCHMFFCSTLPQDLPTFQHAESSQMFRLGSAEQLYEAGVRFEEKPSLNQQTLLDITFSSSGKMSMPCLHVDDNTNSLLRNLIALEQMKYPCMGLDISAYAVLLLHLVTKPGDVKLLMRKGIIKHHLASDKEMMYLINRLSTGLAFDYTEDKYSLKPVFHELKRYTNSRVPRWRAWLKHEYFKNPWTAISLMAALFLLLLTGLQTYYTVYSYYHPLV